MSLTGFGLEFILGGARGTDVYIFLICQLVKNPPARSSYVGYNNSRIRFPEKTKVKHSQS